MTRSRTIDVKSIVLKMHGAFFIPKNTAGPGGLQKGLCNTGTGRIKRTAEMQGGKNGT